MVQNIRTDSKGRMIFDPKGKLPKGSSVFQQVLEEIARENDPQPEPENDNAGGKSGGQLPKRTPRISGSRWHIARAKMTASRKPAMYKVVVAASKIK